MVKNEINTVLHYNMCLIGGMLGVYALLLRGGNFGSAQTGNLIEALISGLEGNVMDMAVRLMALVIYGATLIAVFLVSKYFKGDMRRLCIVIEAAGIVLAGCIPLTADPIVALYPVFFATACQWGIFSEPEATIAQRFFLQIMSNRCSLGGRNTYAPKH